MHYFTGKIKYILTIAVFGLGLFAYSFSANAVTSTDCSTDLSTPNETYTLSGNTSHACNITAGGITINGGGFSIGTSPSPFPDNSANGWINMSGNVLLMHMNESSGSIADTSGNSANGTITGGVSYGATGKISNALNFDGSSGYLRIPSSASINLDGSSFTASVWFKRNTINLVNASAIMDKNGNHSTDNDFQFLIWGSNWNVQNAVACAFYGDDLTSNVLIKDTNWHQAACVLDVSTGQRYIYVDGVLSNSMSSGSLSGTNAADLVIGSAPEDGSYFNGSLDEVAIWNRALSSSEINNIYNTQYGSVAITGNGNSFDINNITVLGSIISAGATINISNSTVATVDVTGADATGDGQNGGTVNLTNTVAGALIANGGNSTDTGLGGNGGTFNLTNSSDTSETNNAGHCGPHNASCVNIFTGSGGDGDWDNPNNWSKGAVPGPSDSVSIQSNVNYVSFSDANVANATFSNGAVWDPYWNYLTLNITGTTTFNDTSYQNYGNINTKNIVFNDNSYPGAGYVQSDGSGVAIFNGPGTHNNSWTLYYFASIDFNNGAYSNGYIPGGNVTFENTSYNSGSEIDGTVTFKDQSYDQYGYFVGQAYFYNSSHSDYSNFYGPTPIFYGNNTNFSPGYSANGANRYLTSDTNVGNSDFTTTSWIITADNAAIDLSGATCNANTQFVSIGTGSFTYGPNCLAGPLGVSIVSPTSGMVGTWSPFINWNQGAGGFVYTGCQYSFGTSTDWNGSDWTGGESWYGTSCNQAGSSIPAPTRGDHLFAVRATFNGNNSTTSVATVNINYAPSRMVYFYSNGGDNSWANTNNWYTDLYHTIHTNSVPNAVDKVTVTGTHAPVADIDTWVRPSLINAGTIGVIFTSASGSTLSLSNSINGSVTFNGSIINGTTINGSAVFNNTSVNNGLIRNNASFSGTSMNNGQVLGNATFNGDLSSTTGSVRGVKTRYYNATTTTTLNLIGWTVVADGVVVDVSGATHDATTIFRTANGGSFIGGPATVYWWSDGSDTSWGTVSNWYSDAATTTALGHIASSTELVVTLGNQIPVIDLATSTWMVPSGIDASHTGLIITSGSSTDINTGITGSTTFRGLAVNAGEISGQTTFYDQSVNSVTGLISGTARFYGNSINNGILSGDAEFYGSSKNSEPSASIAGSATFNDSSFNENGATITGDVTFKDNTYNNGGAISGIASFKGNAVNWGTIDNDAVFYNDLTVNNGSVIGTKTRYWDTTPITNITTDFVASGPWTLVADGVTVTLDLAANFSTTTIFTTKNGGHFVGEGLPGVTSCLKPLIFPGTYTLSGDISGECTIASNDVILNGNNYTIGHIPVQFPDNQSSSGYVDMTGNVALYHMNDSSGTLADSSGNGIGGVMTGTPIYGVTGNIGSAINFSGSNYITPTTNPLAAATAATISMWIKPTGNFVAGNSGAQAYQGLLDTNPCAAGAMRIYGYGDVLSYDIGGGSPANVSIGDWTGQWHHIALTYSNSTVNLYIDGSLAGSGSGNVQFNTLLLGGFNPTCGFGSFVGTIDEIGVWNRALSPSEISSIYTYQYSGGVSIDGQGHNFNIENVSANLVISPGATINISNSTVSTVNVTGADAAGDAQPGGTITLTNTTAGALVANGGNSTDYGLGGVGGHIVLTDAPTSSATSESTNNGNNGPNSGQGQTSTGGSSNTGSVTVSGCTDPSASNYSSSATVDNGSCRYPSIQVRGCTDYSATNYNPSATVSDGSCHYPTYTPYQPPQGGNGNGNSDLSPIQGISIPVASVGGSLYFKPLPKFSLDTGNVGDTVLGNPLAGLQAPGSLDLKSIKFSFGLPISDFLFAPLPKSISDALSKAPKLAQMIAAVGISRAQDLVALKKNPIKLPIVGGDNTPGLFLVSNGTTTLDTFVANDPVRDMVQLVYAHPGDILNISLIPLSKGKVTAKFNDKTINFFQSTKSAVNSVVTVPMIPGRYLLTTASAPLPLAIEIMAPQPPPIETKPTPLSWWQKVVGWFLKK